MAADVQSLLPLFDCGTGPSWREQNTHLFRSDTSLRWFLRQHRRELVADGALIRHADRWMAVEPNMTRKVLQIGETAAKRAVEPE